MVYDDIIIGSGLSAIATAYGLVSDRRKVLVLTGSGNNMRFYPKSTVPAAHRGLGGLGQYWHGVIPLSLRHRPWGMTEENWTRLARIFYPSADLETQIGQNLYFVPRRPIRPAMHIERLVADGRMETVNGDAQSVEIGSSGSISVKILGSEDILKAGRIWLCAGALDTPGLLMRSGLLECKDRTVSDHVIGYAGIVPANAESDALMHRIERRADGVIFPFSFDNDCSRFCTLRPARFDFAQLDGGISKRAVFGLPTNRIVSALFGNLSLGLISEAVFNKFGMFAAAE
ncbi:MAG TPA: hypothetical protein VGN36_01850, partial [Sphingorhabdus sp.]|nr:hypothetical protein [Sphingorhabdus sp.]